MMLRLQMNPLLRHRCCRNMTQYLGVQQECTQGLWFAHCPGPGEQLHDLPPQLDAVLRHCQLPRDAEESVGNDQQQDVPLLRPWLWVLADALVHACQYVCALEQEVPALGFRSAVVVLKADRSKCEAEVHPDRPCKLARTVAFDRRRWGCGGGAAVAASMIFLR